MHSKRERIIRMRRFIRQNQKLLWFLAIFLGGVEIGCLIFSSSPTSFENILTDLLAPASPSGFSQMMKLIADSCLPTFLLLLVLFLTGLSACGVPIAFVTPLFFGLGIGLTESYYYAQGLQGVGYAALMLLPHTLIKLIAVLIGAIEASRMSCHLCRQLLPRQSGCGGLWYEFKLYLARFLICAALIFVSGALDAVLTICFASHFV